MKLNVNVVYFWDSNQHLLEATTFHSYSVHIFPLLSNFFFPYLSCSFLIAFICMAMPFIRYDRWMVRMWRLCELNTKSARKCVIRYDLFKLSTFLKFLLLKMKFILCALLCVCLIYYLTHQIDNRWIHESNEFQFVNRNFFLSSIKVNIRS